VDNRTQRFYDGYWPENIPDYKKTREHVISIIPDERFGRILDAGCGTGVCSIALSERGERVVSLDISRNSIHTAKFLANKLERENIDFVQGDLLDLPIKDRYFNLVFSWGAIHHTKNPERALKELVRVMSDDGTLVLAIYRRTRLTFFHEFIRKLCLNMPHRFHNIFVKSIARFIGLLSRFMTLKAIRDDNPCIESKIIDWYFVPEKHFFTINEMKELFDKYNLEFELLYDSTGRFKSTSNFIVRGRKNVGRNKKIRKIHHNR